MGSDEGPRWNHNIHLHRVVIGAIPPQARSALDVGAGDGMLSAELRRALPDVVGIDVDGGVLARAAADHPGIRWIEGDVMTHEFGRTFDVVTAVATVHHLPDLRAAIGRLAELTSPGGALVIVGLARPTTPWDHLLSVVGVIQHRWMVSKRGLWEHTARTTVPAESYRQVRRVARDVLPGVRWRQHALWRYSLIWRRDAQ
ncbi:class I SAM-dependent methyltransferase [Microbacterium oleivorans]|uniref:Class I SAM-dependent methyltransferase n=1 Tax=Microbacterium oleivorans TaxID=273677 RepID=A0A4R5YMG8_9MICO|nr:class I SAM-dependent methyltransferase [Microbacterium oleivorans]TDL45861.1 class I SAM-dependent methyltransferase [Microbacterium oleivorans]